MKTIAITSGKGGVGKTNVSVNLGLAFAEQGLRVLLLDADLGLANVDVVFGFRSQATLADVVDGQRALQDILVEVAPNLSVIPAASGILRLERLSSEELRVLAADLRAMSDTFDLLLIDTGAGLTESVLFFSSLADHVLVVATPDPASITDSYALIKVLSMRRSDVDIHLLINQTDRPEDGPETFRRLQEVSDRFLGMSISHAGCLPNDTALSDAVRARRPVLQLHPQAEFSRELRDLAKRVRSTLVASPPRGVSSFWDAWVERHVDEDPISIEGASVQGGATK